MAIIYGVSEATKKFLKKLPKEVKSLDDISNVHQKLADDYNEIEDKGLRNKFSRWRIQRKVKKIVEMQNDVEHKGARGEDLALEKLSELSDDFHVFCGVNLTLPNYVTYNGKKNLKSAQMDFVVVSTKGVVLIEVKNWSDDYVKSNKNLSPHEQVDRASRVLWISLKSWRSPKDPSVKSVILSITGNIQYDKNYKFVSVSNYNNINSFLENRQDEFSEKDVERIVGRLKGHFTK